MSFRQLILITLLASVLIFSCGDIFNTDDTKLSANAGLDQATIVGSYAILDASKSEGDIDWYEWEQDAKNPREVIIFSGNDNYKQQIGFVKEGVYKFRLIVKSGSKSSVADEASVMVNSNPNSLFEDPNLEIAVRFMLKKPTDILTDEILLTLDSLRFFDIVEDITSLQGLQRCKNLTCLQMGHQSISDVYPVGALTKLRVLDLTQNRKISDVTPLAGLNELEWLDLDSNLITDISSLINLLNLKYLNLQLNQIENIDAIKHMIGLETLFLFRASLENISAISNLTKLTQLWVVDCGLHDISCLRNLENINNLHLAWNQINNIEPISNLMKLEWVALEQNNISDISALKDLLNLEYVRLWDNQITNIKPLLDNAGIGKGDIVALNGNPLDEISINEYIPALQASGVAVTW